MNVFSQILDAREQAPDWQHTQQPPAARLLKFDAWSRRQLAERLDWSWAGPHRERRIEQARVYLERMVLGLWRRGWMLDGRRLADRITTMLDTIAAYQRAGRVRSFWPYFTATVDRYVGINSEELQAEAMQAGASVGQAMAALLKTAVRQGPTLPELMAQRAQEIDAAKVETLREQQARQRRALASQRAAAGLPQLL